MKVFTINDKVQIVCEAKKTRRGFKHEATLVDNTPGLNFGNDISKTVKNYLNRTWESFEFESVINELLDKTKILNDSERKEFMARISDHDNSLKVVAAIAQMGEIFSQTQKQKNDWKTRMLKAGLEGKGLIMPDD